MEKNKEIDWEEVSLKIISFAGEAKINAQEALQLAKAKSPQEQIDEKIKQAYIAIGNAGKQHMDIVVSEAQGTQHPFKVLFMHAEDQFLTIQTLIYVIEELIELHKGKK